MDRLVEVARGQGATLRVNAYQCVKTDRFKLSYAQFWEGYRRLFAAAAVVSCSEPVVRAAMGLEEVRSPCGQSSVRVDPRGHLMPCVYWPVDGATPTIADLPILGSGVLETDQFRQARTVPIEARDCRCQGGCASRRALGHQLSAHDEYCPWARGESVQLEWRAAPAVELMRAGNVCTTDRVAVRYSQGEARAACITGLLDIIPLMSSSLSPVPSSSSPRGVTLHVRLWAETSGDLVRLWVVDNGLGIATGTAEAGLPSLLRAPDPRARRNERIPCLRPGSSSSARSATSSSPGTLPGSTSA